MKIILNTLTLFLLLSFTANAQELKKVKEKHKFGIVSLEEYQVLKSDKTTKHGYYKAFDNSNDLIINGNYEQNEKRDCGNFTILRANWFKNSTIQQTSF